MRINTEDLTLKKNYLQKYKFLIHEYELVKTKKHPHYRFAYEFYKAHDTDRRSFLKYYNRYKQSGNETDLLPRKRGPKWKTRRPIPYIENKVRELRLKGNNRYEIVSILHPRLKKNTPSPSGVYNILRRQGLNKLKPKMQEHKRKIIKDKAGELAHIDSHYLNKGVIINDNKRYYLVGVIDSCTRVAWAEIVEDIKSITVMFAVLKSLNMLAQEYQIKFAEVLTDNGPEFGPKGSTNKMNHPFERLLIEMGIKHRYIRPYRPQTNGKVERFWRTIEEDLFEGTNFDSLDEMKEELIQYLYYYNHERPHQGIGGTSPAKFAENCPRIT
ncbi:MAG TPA: integrase core domain-containing protein [Draconibacterium sp.]|nr:integrase core domain-containing protein [Draconibacterium sp.]